MNEQPTRPGTSIPAWAILLVAIVALALATAALTAIVIGRTPQPVTGSMMSNARRGMMMGGTSSASGAQPGDARFVAGTREAPRVIDVTAGPGYEFTPSSISVVRGETVTFVVTARGPLSHEFMVGPADAVSADEAGTPEVADIGMMQSKSLTYTFDGTGPYAFACHADGHYEAGMHGTITLVG